MPFNSETYHANRLRRSARARIAKARDIKARAAAGGAYGWELDLIAGLCRLAVLDMRLARSHERVRDLTKGRNE